MHWKSSALSIVVCALTVLVSWKTFATGIQVEQRNRLNVFQPTNERNLADYIDLLKVASTGYTTGLRPNSRHKGHAVAPIPGLYWGTPDELNKDDLEDSEPAPLVDKRGPLSYKLKYGGLGKRKHGSNKIRFGGLGKRVSMDDSELPITTEDTDDRVAVKRLLETDYEFFDPTEPNDQPMSPAFDPRQQRKMGKGFRYSGLGKRMFKLS